MSGSGFPHHGLRHKQAQADRSKAIPRLAMGNNAAEKVHLKGTDKT